MPVYLLHGFKWCRQAARIHVIMNNLDDAAPEWLVGQTTTEVLRENLAQKFPGIMSFLPPIKFIEPYDHEDPNGHSAPFAYVADVVHEIKLDGDVDELRANNFQFEQFQAFNQLCKHLDLTAKNPKIAWYVVYCGDEERRFSDSENEESAPVTPVHETFSRMSDYSHGANATSYPSMTSYNTHSGNATRASSTKSKRSVFSRGLKKVFGSGGTLRRSRSLKSLKLDGANSSRSRRASSPPPPVPQQLVGTAH